MELGQAAIAEASLREGLEAATQVGDGPLVGFIHQDLARLFLEQGRMEEGIAALERSDEILRDRTEVQGIAKGARIHAIVDVAAGDPDPALARLREGVQLSFGSGVNYDPWLFFDLFLLLARRGDGRDEVADLLARLADLSLSPAMQGVVLTGEGLFAATPAEAVDRLTEASAMFERLRFVIEHARVLLELARAQRAAGRDAASTVERARSILESCHARLYLAEADALAAADG
jgi:tetratricopeptide (TPR) repeat protein